MKKQITLEELAEKTQCELMGTASYIVTGVDELETATNVDVSFLSNQKYRLLMKKTKAGVVCVDRTTPLEEGKNYLISDNPSYTFQKIIHILAHDASPSGFKGIHPTAVVHQSAKLGREVTIGPYVVIDRDTVIGDRCKIYSHANIGPEVNIKSDCTIYSNVTIREGTEIGNRVILQPGSVIGSCGYGYLPDEKGNHHKITHFGKVILEDDVEIGANSTIDRARFKETKISSGTKVDNLVQIAHNVTLGKNNLIVAQCGISGSSKTGRNVTLAGQVGVVGHLELGDEVVILARGAASKSILEKGVYGGAPAVPAKEWQKQQVHFRKIKDYANRLKTLEEKIKTLEEEKTHH